MKLHLKESEGTEKVTGRTWKQFINNIENETRFTVADIDKTKPGQWITLFDKDHRWYEVEVTKYSDGEYELLLDQTYPK